jgi:uncharacterized protein with HEPN domain
MIASFPHPQLPEVSEDPSYQELVAMRNALKHNYASVTTDLGGGEYGYLGGLLSASAYALVAPGTPFVPPAHPGPQPIIAVGTTSITSGNTLRIYTEITRSWREWCNLERAGKKQLQIALPKALLAAQVCPNRGLTHLTTKVVLEQVFSDWGQVTQQDMVANRNRLHEEWDPSRPFSDLIQRVQEIEEYATDGQRPIRENDIVDAIYTVIYNTGVYFDDCVEWDDKPATAKTWPNFKAHFNQAQLRARRRQKATTKMTGFHGANAVYHGANATYQDQLAQTENALVNMVTTASEDREQMRIKDKTIADQVTLISTLTQQLNAAQAKITQLLSSRPTQSSRSNPQAATPSPNSSPTNIHNAGQTWVNGKHKKDKGGYCWTHGFLVDPASHNSANCRAAQQKPGHNAEATRDNTLGGNEYGKPRK